jgi:hypothetical protein
LGRGRGEGKPGVLAEPMPQSIVIFVATERSAPRQFCRVMGECCKRTKLAEPAG